MTLPRRRRITVLNSSPEFLELIDFLLEDDGPYRVTTMRLRDTTIERLTTTDPELVIVDLMSEGSFSEGLVRDMKDAPRLQRIPIIVTTPMLPDGPPHVDELLEQPNVHHLPKPFTTVALEELVQHLLPSA